MARAALLLCGAVMASDVPAGTAKSLGSGAGQPPEAGGECQRGERAACIETGSCAVVADSSPSGCEAVEGQVSDCITQADMDDTIDAWIRGVVSIGQQADNCTAAKEAALSLLNTAYAYDVRGINVLFKPTLAEFPQRYRPTKRGALSYFVGGCVCPGATSAVDPGAACGEAEGYVVPDSGFALAGGRGWAKAERGGVARGGREGPGFWYNSDGPFCHAALAQGPICLTNGGDGSKVCVDKTFGFVQNPDPSGPLRALISVHHSSTQVASV